MTLYNKKLKVVGKFASRDETRPILGAVHITPTHLVATDSFRMIRVSIEAEGQGRFQDFPKIGERLPIAITEPVNVKATQFVKALTAIKARRMIPVLSNAVVVEEDENSISFGVTDLEDTTVFGARKVIGTFPDYEGLMPKTDPLEVVTVDAGYLDDIAKAFKEFGAREVTVELRGPLKPVMFTGQNAMGQTIEVLQMPLRPPKGVSKPHEIAAALEELTAVLKAEVGAGKRYAKHRDRDAELAEARNRLDALLMAGDE